MGEERVFALSRRAEITILGQKYVVRSDQDEVQLQQVAEFVDSKLKALQRDGHVNTVRVAVLGALNIANEYFLYRRRMESMLDQMEERTNRLAELVNERTP